MHGIATLDRWRGSPNVVAYSRDVVPVPSGRRLAYQDLRPVLTALWAEDAPVFATTVRALGGRRPSYGVLAGGASALAAQARGQSLPQLIEDHFGS